MNRLGVFLSGLVWTCGLALFIAVALANVHQRDAADLRVKVDSLNRLLTGATCWVPRRDTLNAMPDTVRHRRVR